MKESIKRIEKSVDRLTMMMVDVMVSKGKAFSSNSTEGLNQKGKEVEEMAEVTDKFGWLGKNGTPIRTQGDRSKFKRLQMHVFTGANLHSWFFRAERYFEIHQFTEWEKITATIISFEEYIVTGTMVS